MLQICMALTRRCARPRRRRRRCVRVCVRACNFYRRRRRRRRVIGLRRCQPYRPPSRCRILRDQSGRTAGAAAGSSSTR